MLFLVSLTTYGPGRVRLTTTTMRVRRDAVQAAGFDPDDTASVRRVRGRDGAGSTLRVRRIL
jgi:hypothetical protein